MIDDSYAKVRASDLSATDVGARWTATRVGPGLTSSSELSREPLRQQQRLEMRTHFPAADEAVP
jgi:hypothetical protein